MLTATAPAAVRADSSSPEHFDYRPALDGIRAVAVLAVIGYHVTATKVPGGFLGVDVFFVLSGYLITTLLLREHARNGRVRLAAFWARRARRLLPAVLLLVLVVAVEVSRSAPVVSLAERRGDMLSTLLYFANWHFIATDQSYFAAYAGASPLRHMWSLGIEEQFYLAWPLLLGGGLHLARRRPSAVFGAIVGAAVLSAVAMWVLYDPVDPSRAYYGTDTRAYDLLIGAGLAVLVQRRPALLTGRGARAVARISWPVVAVVVAVAFLRATDQDARYYSGGGVAFALVVAAALWIVEALPHSVPARLLSVRPMRWTGQISYGLYLWHWPLILWIGASARVPAWASGHFKQLVEVVATFVVASASFYLLERPIRRGNAPWLGRSVRRLAIAVPVTVAIVAALAVYSTSIVGGSAIARDVADTSDPGSCPAGSPSVGGLDWCVRVSPGEHDAPVVAVIGDSTSRALNPGMLEVAGKRRWRYIQAGEGGCSFLPLVITSGPTAAEIARARNCRRSMATIYTDVMRRFDPDVWIVSDRIPTAQLVAPDGRLLAPGAAGWHKLVVSAATGVLRRLTSRGAQVVLLATPPVGEPVDCATRKPAPKLCGDAVYSTHDRTTRVLDAAFRDAARALPGKVALVSLDDVLCPRVGRCPAVIGGSLARYDGYHFTATFSRKVLPLIVRRAQAAGVSFRRRR